MALSFLAKRRGGKPDSKLDAFLGEQIDLIRLQKQHMHDQEALQMSRLRLGRWKDRVSLALQVMTAVVGLAAATALGAMAWQAHEDHGVAITAFSVPPDLAQRGQTGQVVASQLLDGLAELQAQTVTARPASTYANDWGDDIKVEIPETGVSIGELNGWLRQWLGSQTRITGEVVRTTSGLAVTARAGAASGRRFEGAEADLDRLVGQAAEGIYAQTQPYRYAVWLSAHGRRDEAIAAFTRLTGTGPPQERAWAYTGWASMLLQESQYWGAARLAKAALRLEPRLDPAYPILSLSLASLGREEEVQVSVRQEIALLNSGRAIAPMWEAARLAPFLEGVLAVGRGDLRRAAALLAGGTDRYDLEGRAAAYDPRLELAGALTSDHDVAAARRLAPDEPGRYPGRLVMLDDWNGLASTIPATLAAPTGDARATQIWPDVARVYAHLGRFAEAEALLAQTALDCDPCLRSRGEVAALKHDWPAADRWYAEAVRQETTLPFAHTEWGQALLAKGDLDGAIAKLKEAHRRSPHFADPLELWGEALMRKGDVEGAVVKYREADKYAPRWGRDHLRWGQALARLGKTDEAKAQWRAAAGMDLSAADRAELTRVQNAPA